MMTDEHLEEIRRRARASQSLGHGLTWYRTDTLELLEEIDRLRSELAQAKKNYLHDLESLRSILDQLKQDLAQKERTP